MREQIHGEAGSVHIPGYLLPVRLSTLAISYRLLVALRRLRRSFIGDLDGLSSKHLLDVDARGSDLMTELIDLIQSIPAAPQHYDSSSTDPPSKSRPQIPRCAPRRFYYRSRHFARPPCNASSPSENRRFTIQPLTLIPKFPGDVSKLLSLTEQRLARFIPRDLAIIKPRYGADAKPPATLLDICRNLTLTPEGVRHILHERLTQLRESREITEPITQLASFCHQHHCILTPALLSQWLPHAPNPNPDLNRASLDFPFLVRLLSELSEELPTWPSAKTLH